MRLRYGKNSINFEISGNHSLGKLEPKKNSIMPLESLLKKSITQPIGRPRLTSLLRKNKPSDLIIVVSDITRSIANYHEILEFLIGEIIDAGVDEKNIEFVIALGTHRRHTPEDDQSLYGELIKKFRFSSHDCRNNLTSLGKTSTGLEVWVNKRVSEADFVIATGRIDLHYLAGFSGGRKSILPGISSYETIRNNHCKLTRDGVAIGKTKNNIIAQEMSEACRLFNVDYLLNVVETPKKETAQIFCGDPFSAFEEGVEFFKSIRTARITQKADCAIVSVGGYPNDKDFYNSHKSLNMATNAIKPNGSIVLIAQCSEGFGNEKFIQYMNENNLHELLNYKEENIEIGGHRAFVTAKILKDHNVYVLSDLDPKMLTKMHFMPISNLEEAITLLQKEHGEEFSAYVIPDGKSVLPILNRR